MQSQNDHNVHNNGVTNSRKNLACRKKELYLDGTYNATSDNNSTTPSSNYHLRNNDVFIGTKNTGIEY